MARQVEIIGHRGARGLFPENTLEGFRAARDLGLTAFELDVGMTADGVVVVHHDLALNPDIARDASGRYVTPPPLIHGLSFPALRGYDVGRVRPASAYRLAHRAQRPVDGARIPTLREVLTFDPSLRFIIELKTDPNRPADTASPIALADAVLAVVDEVGAAARVTLESFDWRGPRHVRRVRPDIALAWLTRAETVRAASLWWDGETPKRYGSVAAAVAAQGGGGGGGGGSTRNAGRVADAWAPGATTLRRAAVDRAHALGLRVLPWTVNRAASLRRLIAWGVDGLITDRPDIAFRVAAGHSD